MTKRLAKQWVAALRSGDYNQGKMLLCSDRSGEDRFCCIGVLCDIGLDKYWERDNINSSIWNIGEFGVAMDSTHLNEVGLDSDFQDRLIRMNDDGHSFEDIAEVIEKEYDL